MLFQVHLRFRFKQTTTAALTELFLFIQSHNLFRIVILKKYCRNWKYYCINVIWHHCHCWNKIEWPLHIFGSNSFDAVRNRPFSLSQLVREMYKKRLIWSFKQFWICNYWCFDLNPNRNIILEQMMKRKPERNYGTE